jgi:hypothetical protein
VLLDVRGCPLELVFTRGFLWFRALDDPHSSSVPLENARRSLRLGRRRCTFAGGVGTGIIGSVEPVEASGRSRDRELGLGERLNINCKSRGCRVVVPQNCGRHRYCC